MPDITSLGIKVDSTDVTRGTKALNALGKAGGTAEKGVKKAETSTERMNKTLKNGSSTITGYVASLVSIAAATALIFKGVKDFAAYEKGLIGVQKTTDFTAKQMGVFKGSVQSISRELPIATLELLAIAEAAGQLGVKGVGNISKFTETMGKLQLATDVVGDEGAKSIARLLTITGEGVGVIDNFGAVLVALGNNSAASESEILSLATRLGSATSTFKLSANEVIGLSAGMKSLGVTSELGGTVVGKAMRKIESSINAGGESMEYLSKMTGIAGKDLKKTFKDDAAGVFTSWLKGMGEMIESGEIAEDILGNFNLAGDEVLATLPKMALGYKTVSSSMKIMSDEQKKGTALNIEAAKAADSLDSQLKLIANITNEVSVALGESLAPYLRSVITDFLKWWDINDAIVKQDLATVFSGIAESVVVIGEAMHTALGWAKQFDDKLEEIGNANTIRALKKELEGLELYSLGLGPGDGTVEQTQRQMEVLIEMIDELENGSAGYADNTIKKNEELVKSYEDVAGAIPGKAKPTTTGANTTAPTGNEYADLDTSIADFYKSLDDYQGNSTQQVIDSIQMEEDAFLASIEKKQEAEEKALEYRNKLNANQAKYAVDMWQVQADDKAAVDARAVAAEKAKYAKLEGFTKEFTGIANAATSDIVSAFVAGEDTKVAVAGIASSYLEQYAIDAATKGLEPIFSALGAQIGAWVGLGTAQSATDGSGWVEKLANAGLYLAGAGAAVYAGKAIGDNFNVEGGWLGNNPGGGKVSGGPPGVDTVFGGYTDGGSTRNWLNNNEYVIDAETAGKNYDILEAMRGSKKRMFADGGAVFDDGPVADAWGPTRGINDSGFDTFWDSVIESKGDWWSAVAESIGYYAGTGAGMIGGKAVGQNLFANGGPVRDRMFGWGGWITNPVGEITGGGSDDILDPAGVFHDQGSMGSDIMDIWAGGDPGTSTIGGQFMPWIGGDAGTSLPEQWIGTDVTSVDWGPIWAAMRDLPIVGETVERADKILYPFVRDTLTPGKYPDFGTVEDMLRGTYEGLGSELATHASTGGASMLLGSFETGTDYVPQTGPYLLHGGESVTSVPQKQEQTESINTLILEVKQLRTSLESLGASTVVATKKTAKVLDRMYADSLEVTA